MRDFTVSVDRTDSPARLDFAPRFNAAVPFIDRHVEDGRGDKIALRCAEGDVTYGELAERVNRCGNALLARGLGKGDRLLMVVKDRPAFCYLFWGAIKAGIVPAPLNTLLRHGDYAFMIERSACAGLCYSPELADEVEAALAEARHRPAMVLVEGAARGDALSLDALMAEAGRDLTPAPAAPEDDCFWLFSSGSTGRPKAAVHRQRDMVVTSEYYGVGCLGLDERDICFSTPRLFFAYGLGNSMTLPFWVGASAVLDARRPTPQTTFEMIERYRPSVYYGVPTLYGALLRAMAQAEPDLSSLRACVSAGEALPAPLLQRWRARTGLDILDGIGSTEALHIFITNRPGEVTPGASGRVVPGYEARILDETGEVVPPGETGRLMIRGPSTAAYYWREPERTARTMKGEWLETGDTYVRDENDIYRYCGRSDDMMKVGGIWCSPFEIEARLIEHPAVLEAAVVGREDGEGLVKPAAFIVLDESVLSTATNPGDGLKDELIRHVKSGLAPYKYPRWITFVDALPKTATGKIQRFKLREG